MKVVRSTLIQHLERLACAGQCTESVFRGAFGASALTPDQLLLINAPSVEGVEDLPDAIGIADIPLLIKALKLLPGEGNIGLEVDIRVERNRLIIDDGERGVQELLIAAPNTIATRVEQATVDKLLGMCPDENPIALTRRVIDGVRGAFSLYKADEVVLKVGTDGAWLTVGSDTTHRARFQLSETNFGASYELLFSKHLVDVFSVITDFSSASLYLAGEKKPILVVDGDYEYMLSPRLRSAERAVKSDKGAEGEETPKNARGRKRRASAASADA